jgi:acetoin utilization deacetylase AcuC-like enzyme
MAQTGLVYRPECLLHYAGDNHPERPDRLRAVMNGLDAAKLDLLPIAVDHATRTDLLRVHTADHIDLIKTTCKDNLPYPDPDTSMGPPSWDAALLAAGGAIAACRSVLEGTVDNAFCATRPPGHHAEADRAMGFCLFNNVAIAARWLREEGGADRVAILDWDVHHGNGTQHSTYNDDTIYYVSLHQHPHYPGTGLPEERGKNNTNLNIPMPPGAGPTEWIAALNDTVIPELKRFAPAFLLISCGFDAHHLDPLADQHLTTETYTEMTRLVRPLANGHIVSLLEGGYDLTALSEGAAAHVRALMD